MHEKCIHILVHDSETLLGCFTCLNEICFPEACDSDEININYKKCLDDLQDVYGQCTLDCYAAGGPDVGTCVVACSDTFIDDHTNCPCQAGCPEGCPCGNYDCQIDDSTDDYSVLVLQHAGGNNKMDPFVIDFNGSVNKDVTFRFEDNTDVYAACSVLYRERWYVFGGNYQPRQVSSNSDPFIMTHNL